MAMLDFIWQHLARASPFYHCGHPLSTQPAVSAIIPTFPLDGVTHAVVTLLMQPRRSVAVLSCWRTGDGEVSRRGLLRGRGAVHRAGAAGAGHGARLRG